MLDWLRYRYQLARLQRTRRKVTRSYRNELRTATAQNRSQEERDRMLRMAETDLEINGHDIARVQTSYLLSIAAKHLVQVPEIDYVYELSVNWKRSPYTGEYYLTAAGMQQIRSALRTELKERSELFRSWLTSLTGLIGVLIGLLAVILRHR